MTPLIELRDVVVERGASTILDVPALSVEPESVLAVLGRNGAGKSTLLRSVGGLVRPTRGTILIDGGASTEAERRRIAAAVLQRPLLRRGTVRANIEAALAFRGVARSDRAARSALWMERLGLSALAGRDVHRLSGGEAQRVSLARALALRPRLLLLDEPFTSLDAPAKWELLADLRRVTDDRRYAVLFVTHDRHEASLLADRVAILDQGRVIQEGTTAAVYDAPCGPVSADLLGYRNQLPAAALPPAIPRRGTVLLFRPADAAIAHDGAGGGWAIPAVTVRATIDGDAPSVVARVGDDDVVARTATAPPPAPGQLVSLVLDPARVRWY